VGFLVTIRGQEAFSLIALGLVVQIGFVFRLFELISKKFQIVIDSIYCICRMRASLNGKLLSEPFIESV